MLLPNDNKWSCPKISSWLIGILSLLLNGSVQVRNICSIRRTKTSTTLIVKVLIILISFGDWLVGGYLLLVAVVDSYFGNRFCSEQVPWLLSSYCSTLGVVSTVGSQVSLFSMTILNIIRLVKVYQRLSAPGPVNKKSYILVGSISLFVVGSSVAVAVIPLMPRFEDTFANALYFPNINFLRRFATKMSLKTIIVSYYGRIRLEVSEFSWEILRSMIDGMFTNDYGGIANINLGFYSNDLVCLFKFFVSLHDAQITYTWSLLATNFVCFGVMSVSYVAVFLITSTSSSSSSQGAAGIARKRNERLQRKISFIILTDFLSWIPFIAICFLHTMGTIDASPWYALLSILILQINSIINPLLYDSVIVKGVTKLFHKLRRTPNTNNRAQAPGPSILLDVVREPEQTTPPILSDIVRKSEHTTPPILSDIVREPEHTTPPILSDIVREPGHTTPLILLDVIKEPGHTTPPTLADVVRDPGHTTSPTLANVDREPEHTTPPTLADVVRDPGHTTSPTLANVDREPEHTTPPTLADVVREPGHTTPPILPDVSETRL